MAEQKMIMVGVLPILLILVVLVVFGVTWLFHHHHWRPFAGLLLLIVGVVCLLTLFGRIASPPVAVPALPRSVRPAWEIEQAQSRSGDARSTTNEATMMREYTSKQSITAEKPISTAPPSSTAVGTDEKKTERTENSSSDHASSSVTGSTKDGDKKPYWVGRPPHFEQHDNGERVYVASVASGEWSTPAECEKPIVSEINKAVSDYADGHLSLVPGADMTFDRDYIYDKLVRDRYPEQVERSVGSMYQLHAMVVIDGQVQRELESRLRTARVAGRLEYAAAGTAIMLLVLGGVYSLLKKGSRRPTTAAT